MPEFSSSALEPPPSSDSCPSFSSGENHKKANMSEHHKKMTSSRKHHLKSVMLAIAEKRMEQEKLDIIAAKEAYLNEHCPALSLPSSLEELQKICKELHQKIDKVDEERYDTDQTVTKGQKAIDDLNIKVVELKGMKKPALKKVRMSADQMLHALLGSKHKVTMDLRSNLKQVKKEVKVEEAGDWRANIEDQKDRKKMFEGAEA
ncbi:troponin I, fast skeletal muscle-like [Engraulis encrasicolus]|uniref:troponin I, fast skeletal muscle-like n=1 Tax=Engraulis encrasicolus TaxID=184585 RepID=UPI002FD54307